MSNWQDSFTGMIDHVAATVAEYAQQIDTGVYGRKMFEVYSADESDPDTVGDCLGTFAADDEDDAYTAYVQSAGVFLPRELVDIEESDDGTCDEPTIVDDDGNHESIYDWPLEVVVKIGRPLAVVISTGGPHIEIVQDLGEGSAHLVGYWGGEKLIRHGSEFQTVLDYLTAYAWDEAPDEYK